MKRTTVVVWLLLVVLTGCSAPVQQTSGPNLVDQSAAEATAIIQRAQATAMVLQAQAQATALVQSAGLQQVMQVPTVSAQITKNSNPPDITKVTSQLSVQNTPDPTMVKVIGVGFAADGTYICVIYTASPEATRNWQQGNISVTDEGTGTVYNFIPVMPILGPLLGRPRYMGQIGYVMLINKPPGLQAGAKVTVILGSFKQEHIVVQQ